ncbi:hypothetical protein N0V87_003565 [Didymella glomerata]|uniref:Frequency clock protein n=1 Tax=Didymella glomerata TaxID=749621 RepID=A0A9W9C2K0_9PLEO|nr:hypothetical protein N0V87_003565 [Didymella glomerata]
MDERPGTIAGTAPATASHPRRVQAHQSVSLRHSPPAKHHRAASTVAACVGRQSTTLSTSPNAPASDKANPPSSVSPRLHLNNHSSGESSDAAGWFEKTNNDMGHDASFVDNDPPFLLHNSSSSDRTPPDAQHLGMPPLPYRPNLMHLGTDGSSTEDFRSVIDDLTIANKKLKQRLRKYEQVYDAHLQEEKLFEVRFHGLPDHKKKELEETLRKFAAGLDDSTERPEISYVPALNKEATVSSTSRFAESGYVSMSASGQNSSTPSNGASNQPTPDNRRMTKSAYNRQQQSIQSYLHDIPQGLLPQDNAPMSDKARKKMVVRRLEQIFAGKRSVPGQHPQPMQQEEVAQSAATADRREREATGRGSRPEGQRTALIMPERADTEGEDGGATLHIPAQQRVHEQDFAAAGSGSPDQRPTRPLDLDPYRAQVPAANMEYFRHLGFSPPNMTTSTESEGGHGWLYLNLLINLAQLHTLNVTPENVKDAIAEHSTQLELSSDGRKIRWKGGHDFSKDSSEGSPEQMGVNSPYQMMGMQKSPQKSSKTGNSASIESSGNGSSNRSHNVAPAKPKAETNKFAYKPLFFRRESSEEDQDFYDQTESSSSLFQPQQRGDSSGLGSSVMQSNLSGKRRDDGPMIFYSKARFCTDLTGDRVGASLTLPENYKTITSHPLGAQLNTESTKGSEIWEARGPLDDADMDSDSKTGAQTPSTLESLGFSPADLQRYISAASADMMDFEASGLGGVQPDDNFSIRVQRAQIPTALAATQNRRASLYPAKIQAILGQEDGSQERRRSTSPKETIKEELISAVRQDMPSSILPPPSFYPFDSNSSGEMSDDEESDDEGSDTGDGPSTALQLLNVAPPGLVPVSDQTDLSSEASEYSSDDDDDVSVDLLATARQQDPDTVRAFEREYDAAVADRLADEIVAGSSAATAGGGSGFNSPASQAGHGQSKGSRRSTRNVQSSHSEASLSPRSKNLKRARTSESIATVMKNGPKAPKTQRTE